MQPRSESARTDVVDKSLKFIGPGVDDTNRFFFDATSNGQLAFQRCRLCATWWSLPAYACYACGATEFDVVATSGRGSVHTYAIPRRPSAALIDEDLVFVVIELDEGLRYFSRLVGIDPAAVNFGMRVEVQFAAADSGVMVPVFAPAGAER
ncbi:Zn-ribbon domain-containing OB-fold protein [Mycobacterium paraffinicum]|uniref:Zn-ribbon domain-containing OB-fold protein n=1 Tax=Mycobacterium paraffinicum TaxID=53378 RepID=UPI000A797F92|nr:OB-fold domain-containing protein [Mycobacterium paraffinicum]